MKKFIILLIVFIGLSSFTFKVEDDGYFAIKCEVLKVDDMKYMVIYNKYVKYSGGGASTAVAVVNITKDKLEIEKAKLEIQYLKKQLNKK